MSKVWITQQSHHQEIPVWRKETNVPEKHNIYNINQNVYSSVNAYCRINYAKLIWMQIDLLTKIIYIIFDASMSHTKTVNMPDMGHSCLQGKNSSRSHIVNYPIDQMDPS